MDVSKPGDLSAEEGPVIKVQLAKITVGKYKFVLTTHLLIRLIFTTT